MIKRIPRFVPPEYRPSTYRQTSEPEAEVTTRMKMSGWVCVCVLPTPYKVQKKNIKANLASKPNNCKELYQLTL